VFFKALYANAPEDEGLLVEVAYGKPPLDRIWIPVADVAGSGVPVRPGEHCFYGPALRREARSGKDAVWGTQALWVDRDDAQFARATFPPSFVIWSGHGWHYFWLLTEWATDQAAIEKANQLLLYDVEGDKACWNVDRLLRVPGSDNSGVEAELRHHSVQIRYSLDDIKVLAGLDDKIRHKVRTGDRRGYPSRSERDWAVVSALLKAGAQESLIETIFQNQPVGDKVRDAKTSASYLQRTIERARVSPSVGAGGSGLEERGDGYYVHRGKNVRRLSTFLFEPELLLDGRAYGSPDALVGTVRTERSTWPTITFTRQAFQSVRMLDRETPYMGWQWLGRDDDVRGLLPYLIQKLKDKGFPRRAATGTLGLHRLGERYLFVGTEGTLSAEDYWLGSNAPLVYLETHREHPILHLAAPLALGPDALEPSPALIGSLLPTLNEPETIWPIIGWYCAAPLKPWLEEQGLRFPILNVYGTKGSGKTTTIQRVMLPLLGQRDPRSYDANTTRFVVLSLLGSSNAVPVAFSEFRFGAADKFLRYVLLSYDTGHDPRGRADQTTVDYPLSAPFSVDGEDLIADPAAKERILAVVMHPAAIAEGTEAFNVRQQLESTPLLGFASGYYQYLLRLLLGAELEALVQQARADVLGAFPSRLPDRVRSNLVVARLGQRLFAAYTGVALPDAKILSETLSAVFSTETGRAPVAADYMVEDLVNAAARSEQRFTWSYDAGSVTFFFQLSSAYEWWSRTRRDRPLGRDALRVQLKELDYVSGPLARGGHMVYAVVLTQARTAGLDVPERLAPGTLEVRF